MATQKITFTTPDISTLSNGQVLFMSSLDKRNLFINIEGIDFINEDSSWDLVVSNDKSTWVPLVTPVVFTGELASNQFRVSADALYIGCRIANKATETAGYNQIIISARD